MRYKLTFTVGFAAGYVLGARAGTERYQQIENAWRRFVDTPAVQQAAGVVGAQAGQVFEQAKQTVGSKVSDTVGSRLRPGQRASGSRTSADRMTAPSTPAASEPASPYPTRDFGGHA
jgi:hypothetical protein